MKIGDKVKASQSKSDKIGEIVEIEGNEIGVRWVMNSGRHWYAWYKESELEVQA